MAPGVDEVHSEFLKALDVVGLSWLAQVYNVRWQYLRTGGLGWWLPSLIRGTIRCAPTIRRSHSSASPSKSMSGCWKGESQSIRSHWDLICFENVPLIFCTSLRLIIRADVVHLLLLLWKRKKRGSLTCHNSLSSASMDVDLMREWWHLPKLP